MIKRCPMTRYLCGEDCAFYDNDKKVCLLIEMMTRFKNVEHNIRLLKEELTDEFILPNQKNVTKRNSMTEPEQESRK